MLNRSPRKVTWQLVTFDVANSASVPRLAAAADRNQPGAITAGNFDRDGPQTAIATASIAFNQWERRDGIMTRRELLSFNSRDRSPPLREAIHCTFRKWVAEEQRLCHFRDRLIHSP
jgi:hypothetical protein